MAYDIYGRTSSDYAGTVNPGQMAAGGTAFGPIHMIRVPYAAAAQDVTVFGTAGAPYKLRVVDAFTDVDTGNASETLTIRDASGGSGNALSAALSLASTGRIREAAPPATRTLAAGGNLYFRRNTTTAVGSVILLIQYES